MNTQLPQVGEIWRYSFLDFTETYLVAKVNHPDYYEDNRYQLRGIRLEDGKYIERVPYSKYEAENNRWNRLA